MSEISVIGGAGDALRVRSLPEIRAQIVGGEGVVIDKTGGVIEVKIDVARETERLAGKVDKAGDTMTGPLALAVDATADMQPTTLRQVTASVSPKLNRDGRISVADWTLPRLDGGAHLLSERFATLAAAQAVFPFATSLAQTLLDCIFQAAVNALPAEGGTIHVPPGNYTGLNGANVILPARYTIPGGRTSRRMVTWSAYGATLPRGLPGVVLRAGNFRGYDDGGVDTGRFGDAAMHLRFDGYRVDPTGQNQEDGVIVVEGEVPADSPALDGQLAAFEFSVGSRSTNPANALRGLHGSVSGLGGSAKLRAIRTTAFGYGGHDGICTGAMFGATRQGLIPTAFGGDGTATYTIGQAGNYGSSIDFAVVGQAGPGIRGVFMGQSFDTTPAQPQSLLLQGRGAAALRPTFAVLDLHAGGSGKIVSILASDETTPLASWERDGSIRATSFASTPNGSVSCANDAVIQIAPPKTSGTVRVHVELLQNSFVDVWYRTVAGGGAALNQIAKGSVVDLLAAGVVPTGTTGTTGRVSVSIASNTIYVENRSGAARNVAWAFIA